ncbi:hypothetical protein HM1_1055 [Heliomicrobium modesticaldum Ice1]|uniref:Uncharacterized protein n=1 Tax=Heliobacterium modesticaldum (strain ATCC 51547 / Ice1) TaxID=498761 RepID=B0TI99_HELMI|nr:hypothetical protein HM1_1055 [Heliomicrobium modesticaldum Ice1]
MPGGAAVRSFFCIALLSLLPFHRCCLSIDLAFPSSLPPYRFF